MVRFFDRSQHCIKAPHKPIKQGYKILALCDHGYTSSWIYSSRTQGFANLTRLPNLSTTSSTVVHLCQPLPSKIHQLHLYMDNYFTNIPLLHTLYSTLHIGAFGALRMNYIPRQEFNDNVRLSWNNLIVPMTHIFNSIDGVIIILSKCYPVFTVKIGYLQSAGSLERPVLEVPSYVTHLKRQLEQLGSELDSLFLVSLKTTISIWEVWVLRINSAVIIKLNNGKTELATIVLLAVRHYDS